MRKNDQVPKLQRVIEELPAGFDALRAEARDEGYRFAERLATDWLSGTIRFDREGEGLLAARVNGVLAGIGGLTIEPVVPDALRMRRFYVRLAYRRSGIGRKLATALLERARSASGLVDGQCRPCECSLLGIARLCPGRPRWTHAHPTTRQEAFVVMSQLVPIGWRFHIYFPNERRNRHKRARQGATLLMAVIACALIPPARAAGVDWSKARLVTITAVEYAFEPNHLILRRDAPYRLHVENHGRELHELTAPDFFKAVELRNPEVLNPEHTEIVLQPNEQKDLYFVTLRPGHYNVWCADHDWAGMTGDITVK